MKNLILTTALLMLLLTSATGQTRPPDTALNSNPAANKIIPNPVSKQEPLSLESFGLLHDLNGRVRLDAGSEDSDAVMLNLSGQVNLSPALTAAFQASRDVSFVTADPFQCSTSKLYYNRVNQKLWGNSGTAQGCALVSGSGGGGGGGSGDALTGNPLSQFAATTSSQLATVLTDETGSGGVAVFNNTPTLITPIIASFANANHNHTNGATGGQITDTALSAAVGVAKGGTGGTTASEARANLGLIVGADVQAFDSDLATIAGLSPVTNNFIVSVGSAWASVTPSTVTNLLTSAVADGATKGIASFATADFNTTSGVVSIDYTNGQTASGSTKGFLAAADFTTFNAKVSTGAVTGSGLTMATARMLGRSSASTGAIEEISIGAGLNLVGGVLSASASSADMVLAGVQTVTGAKTFNDTKLILGGGDYGAADGSLPAVVANSFVRNTNASSKRLFVGRSDGSAWDEVFLANVSIVNLTSNVTGTLLLANGGTSQTSWTASRCVQVNSGGTALEAASAACGTTVTIASGTAALGTSAIASGACATTVTSTATGVASTDVVGWGFNADVTGVTGYQASANGMLTILVWPTTNTVSFRVCNNTSASITPGAVTLNWRVTR